MKILIPVKKISIFIIVVLFFIILTPNLKASKYASYKIRDIRMVFDNLREGKNRDSYKKLITIRKFERFNMQRVRESINILYKTDRFLNIEVKIDKVKQDEIIIYFIFYSRLQLKRIDFIGVKSIGIKELKQAVRSVRTGTWFDKRNIPKAVNEIKRFLSSKGYFTPEINLEIKKKDFKVFLNFVVNKKSLTKINRVFFKLRNDFQLPISLLTIKKKKIYIPFKFLNHIEDIKIFLKNNGFYFPKVSLKEVFLNKKKDLVNIYIKVNPGFKYVFYFKGMKNILSVVTPIWEKKVFEKWAERESVLKISAILKNSGYLNPEVKSNIRIFGRRKEITFNIKKNKRFKLGKISFSGNKKFSSKILKRVISADDLIFDRIFFLRTNSIKIDSEVLKWFYYYKGFPLVKIGVNLDFKKNFVNLRYLIDEGEMFTISDLKIKGEMFIEKDVLKHLIKSRIGGEFVQRSLDEDIVKIRNYYYSKGFDDIEIKLKISRGSKKSITINIDEGSHFKFGSLIIIGASAAQSKLIKKIFTIKKGDDFNRILLQNFQNKIEKNSIFSELKFSKLKKQKTIDMLVIAIPNRSKYLGFGIGYEERTGVRFTLEYQKKNIFKSYSTFSALVQLGLKERRGTIVYDTPFFLKGDIDSTLKLWEENEIYRSYKFNRYGISESLIKRLSDYSYLLTTLSWYRTKLLELEISESGIDRLNIPFDTTSLNLSYVIDDRDDPFLPKKGEFFSTDIKFAFPLFEKDYSFFRFRWGYQKNIKLLKRGIFSFSVRNGFASGNLSITERFFGGGINTFRGISNDKLGPLDKKTGEPSGGNAMLLINLESTFPLYLIPIENFYYSVFLDVGNIYKGVNEFAIKNIERALGIGLRIKTAIGLLKFDVAYNFRKRENVSPIVFHIGIGNVF